MVAINQIVSANPISTAMFPVVIGGAGLQTSFRFTHEHAVFPDSGFGVNFLRKIDSKLPPLADTIRR